MHPGCHFSSKILLVMVFELGVSWVRSRGLWLKGGHVLHLRYAHLGCEHTALTCCQPSGLELLDGHLTRGPLCPAAALWPTGTIIMLNVEVKVEVKVGNQMTVRCSRDFGIWLHHPG
eukprot:366536-Chlamydomonas_euryale.AAC.4